MGTRLCPSTDHGVVRQTERERRMVDQTLVSWNRMAAWLSRVEALQNVRSFGLRPQD